MLRRLTFGAVALALALALLSLSASARADEPLWALLKAGGQVILVRHAITTPGVGDPPGMRLEECSTQRNLTDEGRGHARRVGEAFRTRKIAVDRVMSSPWCRCLETARLAFKEPEPWPVLQGGRPNSEALRQAVSQIKKAMAEHREGPPLVLVTHGFVITGLTGLDVRMGAFVVMKRGAGGAHTVAGQLYVE